MAWGRRGRGSPPEKTILGGHHLHIARTKIEDLCQRSVKLMAPFAHDMNAVLPWCFADDTLKTLRHAHELVQHNTYGWGVSTNGSYKLAHHAMLTFNFNQVPMLAPKEEMFLLDPGAGQPLLEIVEQIREIKAKFDTAENVLLWLDKHVTAGAMRYYWPAVLSLAPQAPTLQADPPSRFNQPNGIAPLLPAIREAASTIASALLLVDNIETPDRGFSLTLGSGAGRAGDIEFDNIDRIFPL